ncbi:MAG TPA: hypothetical protein VII56_17535 [Rhizomicrobium sp.]
MGQKPPKPADRPSSPRVKQKNNAETTFDPMPRIFNDVKTALATIKRTKDVSISTVIVSASLLEKMLQLGIALKFRKPMSASETASLFSFSGTFGDFATKIRVCHAFGLLADSVQHDLEIVRDIRNDMCHSLTPLDFQDQSIRARCMNLKHGKKTNGHINTESHTRFIFSVLHMVRLLTISLHKERFEFQLVAAHSTDLLTAAARATGLFETDAEYLQLRKSLEEAGAQPHPTKT